MDCDKGDEMNHGVITHFTRSWKTGDAPTFDAEISHETGGIQRKFFAFVNGYNAPISDNSVTPNSITKTWSTSNVKITPVMPVVQAAWEEDVKSQRLDLFSAKTEYSMKVGDSVDTVLTTIPDGPGSTEWEYSINRISGKNYPDFVSLNQATNTLEFRPNLQSYDNSLYYFMLTLQEKGNSANKREAEVEVFVGDPVVLAQKQQLLDDFSSELILQHTMGDY